MRSLYSKDIIDNSYRVSPFHQRSRLKSLKELRQIPFQQTDLEKKYAQQQILQILERKLVEENQKQQNQQVHVLIDSKKYSLHLPSKHTMKQESERKLNSLKQSNKLFQYFEELFRKEVPIQKVEREKVNFCEKQFEEIKTKVESKLELNRKRLDELNQIVKGKYLQLHEYHENAKQLSQMIKEERKLKQSLQQQKKQRQSKAETKANKSTITLRPPSLKQRLYMMDQFISHLKQQTSKLEQEIETTNNKQASIKEEWIMFLKLFLNNGYYLVDGCERLFLEMRKMNVKLDSGDLMMDFIDDNAKRFLLAYYRHLQLNSIISARENHTQVSSVFSTLPKEQLENRERIRSTIEMKSLAKDGNLKKIYSNTKSAMMNLLKNSLFRAPSETKPQKESFLPKIQPRKQSLTNNQSRITTLHDQEVKDKNSNPSLTIDQLMKQEINRINHVYFGNGPEMEEKGKLIKRILFGFNAK